MKTVVFGGGAMGSLFAALLSKAGYDIVLVGRENHVKEINDKGLIIEGALDENIKIASFSDLNGVVGEVDLIILATKSYDTESAMKLCSKIISPKTRVLSIQNGITNEDTILKYTKNVIAGTTSSGVVFMEPGKIRYNSPGPTFIGNYNRGNDDFLIEIKEMFEKAGLQCKIPDNIKYSIFKKFLVNVGLNALGAVADVKNGMLIENPHLNFIFVKIVSEAIEVGKSKGYTLPDNMLDEVTDVIRIVAENRNSMLQDLSKGKRTEVDYFNGTVVEFGKECNIATSYNEFVLNMIRFLEERNK